MSEDALREELRRAYAAHCLCDAERQAALDKIKELQQMLPAQDEDYRYRVEQIAARILANMNMTGETLTESLSRENDEVKIAIRIARKLVCAVEAMDRG